MWITKLTKTLINKAQEEKKRMVTTNWGALWEILTVVVHIWSIEVTLGTQHDQESIVNSIAENDSIPSVEIQKA